MNTVALMPRTRSLAWSELKIGIAGVVAARAADIVVVVAVGGEGGFFVAAVSPQGAVRRRAGLKAGRRRAR